MVKNLLCNAGSIPDGGTKIPHAMGQLNQWATTSVYVLRWKTPHDAIMILHVMVKTRHSQINLKYMKQKNGNILRTTKSQHMLWQRIVVLFGGRSTGWNVDDRI